MHFFLCLFRSVEAWFEYFFWLDRDPKASEGPPKIIIFSFKMAPRGPKWLPRWPQRPDSVVPKIRYNWTAHFDPQKPFKNTSRFNRIPRTTFRFCFFLFFFVPSWGPHGAVLGQVGPVLGASWGHLGGICGTFWGLLGLLGDFLGFSVTTLSEQQKIYIFLEGTKK